MSVGVLYLRFRFVPVFVSDGVVRPRWDSCRSLIQGECIEPVEQNRVHTSCQGTGRVDRRRAFRPPQDWACAFRLLAYFRYKKRCGTGHVLLRAFSLPADDIDVIQVR